MATGSHVYGRRHDSIWRLAHDSPARNPLALRFCGVGMTYKQATPDDKTLARRIKRGVYAYFDGLLHKRCLVCKEYWPADTEFFYDSKTHHDGIGDTCRACSCEQRQYHRANSNQPTMAAA